MEYEAVIGLEVHAELKTKSKVFCGCPVEFEAEPNTRVCPICLGMPGVLPVLNKRALEYAIKAALALNCRIASFSKFDRKNYFYPDLPKNYQISQYDLPLARDGYLEIVVNGHKKSVGIRRVHLEEDAGKLIHGGGDGGNYSLVDYNRTGVPLIEIVSEPDLRSPEEAKVFAEKLKAILQYTGVSDCKMEQGSLRCDVNVSVRPRGSSGLGVKTEIKNLNSFRSLKAALEYEIERQIAVLEKGGEIVQETRSWVEGKGVTVSLRGKEEEQDYRYFPEPDLVPLVIGEDLVEEIRAALPELPDARKERFIREYGLPEYDAEIMTSSRALADFYEACVAEFPEPKAVSNWIMGELLRLLNLAGLDPEDLSLEPRKLAELLRMVAGGTISGKIAKTVFEEMFKTGRDPREIVREKGWEQISDEAELERVVDDVLRANPGVVEDYRGGKDRAFTYLVGQVMKATKGKANPGLVNKLLKDKLG